MIDYLISIKACHLWCICLHYRFVNSSFATKDFFANTHSMSEHKRRERNYSCVVPNCLGRNSTEISLYTIPTDDIDAWCMNLNINPEDVKSTTRVCSRHFEEEFKGAQKLKTGARPTLHLKQQSSINRSYHVSKIRFNPRKCCIEGCGVMQPPCKVYRFPEDPKRRQEWIANCDIKDTAIDNKLKFICGKHFDPSSIAHFRLKKDAVPLAQFRRKRKIQENDFQKNEHNNDNADYFNDDSGDSTDGLECQNYCASCQNNEEYYAKYLDAERRCAAAERQLEEANVQHIIERLALHRQIKELTDKLERRLQI